MVLNKGQNVSLGQIICIMGYSVGWLINMAMVIISVFLFRFTKGLGSLLECLWIYIICIR